MDQIQMSPSYEGVSERLSSFLEEHSSALNLGEKGGRGASLEQITGYSESTWSNWLAGKNSVPSLKGLDIAIQKLAGKIGYPHKAKQIMAWLIFGAEIVPEPLGGTGQNTVDHYQRCQIDQAVRGAMSTLRLDFSDFRREQINRIYDRLVIAFAAERFDPESKDTNIQIIKIIASEL